MRIQFVSSTSWFSWKVAFVEQQVFKSQEGHKCKPPEKVLTVRIEVLIVKLGQYQLQSMLEWYQCFISANTICI